MSSEDIRATKEIPKAIGARIRQERERNALSQADLAELIGSSRINISRWENGASMPSPYFRRQLSKHFKKSVEELGFFSGEEQDGTTSHIAGSSLYLPHRVNSFFTGRKEILKHLRTEFAHRHTAGRVLALTGLGGMGKTQIAVAYAYTYHENYSAIFWLNASTQAMINSDLMTIASMLELPHIHEQVEAIGEAVKRWLATHDNWLLILDNVDALEDVMNLLPLYNTGDVLLTTRLQVVGNFAQRIVVDHMSSNEGVAFLLRRTKLIAPDASIEEAQPESRRQAEAVVEALGGLPLALDQAGAYIEETQCGFTQYLERYQTNSSELLQKRGSFSSDHPESIVATWKISFKAIEEISTTSAELLYFCAFLNSDSIPEDLLIEAAPRLGPVLSKGLKGRLQLDTVLQPLNLYSLIQRSPEARTLTIHRLVQAVLRQNLPLAQQKQWAKRTIRAIDYAFSEPELSNWARCQQLLAQVLACIQLAKDYALLLPELAHLCQQAGKYAFDQALYTEAETFFQKAITIDEQLSSHKNARDRELHPNYHHLGKLYRTRGRYKEAEELLQRVLKGYEQAPIEKQIDYAEAFNSMGELYHNLGRYDEAEPLFKKALSITCSTFGPDHFANSIPLHYLARLYQDQEHYDKAKTIFAQVVKMQQESPDKDEIELAITLNNQATLYRKLGDYGKAETLLQQTLTIFRDALGPDHPRTAIALQNVGIIHLKQGQYKEAEEFLQQALTIKQDTLGFTDRSTIKTIANLAFVNKLQGRRERAKNLLQQALNSVEQEQQEQPQAVVILRNLASIYYEENNYGQAEDLYQQALAISEKDPAHREMSKLLGSLEDLNKILGKKKEAEYFRQRQEDLLKQSSREKEASPENP